MKIQNITIGADPELFISNDKEVVSAEGIIGGTKQEPRIITPEGHAIQEDNVMVEFNIPPSKTKDEFVNNINTVLSFLDMELSLKKLKLHYSVSETLNPKYLKTKQAREFGCEPDFSVYLKDMNKAPSSRNKLRTCGGHIHVGYDNHNHETTEFLIMAMDLFLGVPSVIMDDDALRRKMYGKSGCLRFKPEYGFEYRTLSNFWIYTDELKEWAFDSTMNAIKFIEKEENRQYLLHRQEEIQDCIDNNNIELVDSLVANIEGIRILNKELV